MVKILVLFTRKAIRGNLEQQVLHVHHVPSKLAMTMEAYCSRHWINAPKHLTRHWKQRKLKAMEQNRKEKKVEKVQGKKAEKVQS